jgi:Sulfotransferase family
MPDNSTGANDKTGSRQSPPILLGGDHRSGTTLVSLVLDAHPDVVFGPELEFRLPSNLGHHLLECCDLELARDPAVSGSGVTTADPRWQLGIQLIRQCERFGLEVADLRELVTAEMARDAHLVEFAERARLIERIGDVRRRARGADRWGFKIQRDIVDAAAFVDVWPGALFIHVVRDGRDVAASHLTSGYEWAYHSAEEVARGWVATVSGIPRDELGDQLYEMRYEDLVRRPEPVLRDLLEYLGLPWCDAVLSHELVPHDLASRPYDHPSVDASWRSIDANAISRYRRDLAVEDVAQFESIAGALLEAWGYEVPSSRTAEGAD